jgi:Peptidase family M23/FlgD Ig-like domain
MTKIYYLLVFGFVGLLLAQGSPFMEIRPYEPPEDEQYPVHASMDHYYPTQSSNYLFIRLDGDSATSTDPPSNTCVDGQFCYDGHSGTDIWMPKGVPILAVAPGKVVWASFDPGVSPCPNGMLPNGDLAVVIIDHLNGYYSAYLHMDSITAVVGNTVATADTIAFNGDSGCAGVPHVHFEIRKDAYFFDQEKSWDINPYGWWGPGQDPVRNMRGSSSAWLWKSSPLIDDGDNGFERYYGPQWKRETVGYKDDSWTTPVVATKKESRHFAIWVPELDKADSYMIQAYIPELAGLTTKARYEVYVKKVGGTNKKSIFTVDQTSVTNDFITIAAMDLEAGSKVAVFLRDVVGDGAQGTRVAFDAVRFLPVTTGLDNSDNPLVPQSHLLEVLPNKPNPLKRNSSATNTHFVFKLSKPAQVSISISNALGQVVQKINTQNYSAGTHEVAWNGRNFKNQVLPNGIYFYTLKTRTEAITKKLLIVE